MLNQRLIVAFRLLTASSICRALAENIRRLRRVRAREPTKLASIDEGQVCNAVDKLLSIPNASVVFIMVTDFPICVGRTARWGGQLIC